MGRRFLLQFSLRSLLVAMAVVAIAITVYRRPWVEQGSELYGQSGFSIVERGFGTCQLQYGPDGWTAVWQEPSQEHYEQAPEGDFQTTTTWQRGWSGKPQLHGPKSYTRDGWVYATRLYEHGELRRLTIFRKEGVVWQMETRRNGVADGKYEYSDRARHLMGNYELGKRVGVWEQSCRMRADGQSIAVRQSYLAGRVHGEWTWRAVAASTQAVAASTQTVASEQSASGKVLQSARFDNGQLIEWNGRPWRDELERWYESQRVDDHTRGLLERPLAQVTFGGRSGNDSFATLTANAGDPPDRVLLAHPSVGYPTARSYFKLREVQGAPEEAAIGALLQTALLHSLTLVVRHGVVNIVPICERELARPDRTGIAAVRFPPGSQQQAAWETPVPVEIPIGFNSDWWFQQLFASTPIQIDGSEFNPGPDTGWPWIHTDDRTYNYMDERGLFPPIEIDLSRPRLRLTTARPRHEILALLLASRGWSCEQRGNVVVVHPWQGEAAN